MAVIWALNPSERALVLSGVACRIAEKSWSMENHEACGVLTKKRLLRVHREKIVRSASSPAIEHIQCWFYTLCQHSFVTATDSASMCVLDYVCMNNGARVLIGHRYIKRSRRAVFCYFQKQPLSLAATTSVKQYQVCI